MCFDITDNRIHNYHVINYSYLFFKAHSLVHVHRNHVMISSAINTCGTLIFLSIDTLQSHVVGNHIASYVINSQLTFDVILL